MVSFDLAYQRTLDQIQPLEAEFVGIIAATGRIAALDLHAYVDSPSVEVSLKDGYAIHSEEIKAAQPKNPVYLRWIGALNAGGIWDGPVLKGEALRILSGAPIPPGADAVVSEEFTEEVDGWIKITGDAHPGRNILMRASDVKHGQLLAQAKEKLQPTRVGLLAAGGHHQVPVIRQPKVAILATGDEVIAPGQPLIAGKLYASNLVTLAAWCVQFGFSVETFLVPDDEMSIRAKLLESFEDHDAILTSGGAWKGERDLTVRVLDDLGWRKIYHRVKMGPGKAIGFGLFQGKAVFCLPGGPPSNHMAFLQLALPGLQKMAGFNQPGLPLIKARLAETICGQADWTQFIHGKMIDLNGTAQFHPLKSLSRLQMIAETDAVVKIPEGQEEIRKDSYVQAQILG